MESQWCAVTGRLGISSREIPLSQMTWRKHKSAHLTDSIVYSIPSRYKTALTRGTKAKFPCPRCLVPASEMSNLHESWPLRTQRQSKETYELAVMLRSRGDKKMAEEGLQNIGLCNVQVQQC